MPSDGVSRGPTATYSMTNEETSPSNVIQMYWVAFVVIVTLTMVVARGNDKFLVHTAGDRPIPRPVALIESLGGRRDAGYALDLSQIKVACESEPNTRHKPVVTSWMDGSAGIMKSRNFGQVVSPPYATSPSVYEKKNIGEPPEIKRVPIAAFKG
ncbi:hypothetical protein FB451DRAFT_1199552 [Mycena latifolia]|nr:hypothetical protein FB451DRAFT_1199552 [Mycena latifolia]